MSAGDEERRKAEKPCLEVAEVPDVVRQLFGKACDPLQVYPLDSYDDLNFRIYVPEDGQHYTLKVHNGCESDNPPVLEAETLVLHHLSQNGFTVPESLTSLSCGSRTPCYQCHVRGMTERRPLAVRLMKWVPGVPLSEHRNTDHRSLVAAGEFLGRLRRTLDGFDHPGAHRFHQWDLQQTHHIRPFLKYISSDVDRALVCDVVDSFEQDVIPLGQSGQLPGGLLHGDFNDCNIITAKTDPTQVVGVIDFGDMVYSWRVNELAIAAAYACVSVFAQSDPPHTVQQALMALLEGFGNVAPVYLNAFEMEILRILCCARLALSVTLGAYSFSQNPGNEYLLLHARPAWAALRCLWEWDGIAFTRDASSYLANVHAPTDC